MQKSNSLDLLKSVLHEEQLGVVPVNFCTGESGSRDWTQCLPIASRRAERQSTDWAAARQSLNTSRSIQQTGARNAH